MVTFGVDGRINARIEPQGRIYLDDAICPTLNHKVALSDSSGLFQRPKLLVRSRELLMPNPLWFWQQVCFMETTHNFTSGG